MQIVVMLPIYIALWLLAAHIQHLMRNEDKQDRMYIYFVFVMIGFSVAGLLHK